MKLLELWAVSVFTICHLAAANVNSEKINFDKVRPLFEKLRSGEQLTAAERNLVEQARAARKKALDAGEKDPAAANSEVSRADQPETPDWAMIERLRVKELRGNITADEIAQLYAALAAIDVQKFPAEATKLALVGLAGDGGGSQVSVKPVDIPESISPVGVFKGVAADGKPIEGNYRKPPGSGPFPTILVIPGGLDYQAESQRKIQLTRNPVFTRLLKAGYAVAYSTFRTYPKENLQDPGPILDAVAAFSAVRQLPFVAADSLAVFGGSGGGSLAFEIASREKPAVIIAGEPASILFAGMLTTGDYQVRIRMMGSPRDFYGPRNHDLILQKAKTIRAPVLILHGDIHPLKLMNHELFIPALREAGVNPVVKIFPHQGHGFYFGSGVNEAVVEKVVEDLRSFLSKHLAAVPRPID